MCRRGRGLVRMSCGVLLVGALGASEPVQAIPSVPSGGGRPWRVELVSVNAAGTDGGNPGTITFAGYHEPALSPDGTKVVFTSPADNLGPHDSHSHPQPEAFGDVYMRDLVSRTTTLISVNAAGTDSGNAPSGEPQWTADGTKVVFQSSASDLVARDTNGTEDLFVRDLATGTTSLVTVNAAGSDSGRGRASEYFSVGPDGRHVAFSSDAPDLVPVDTNGEPDVFVRDLVAGTTTLVSVGAGGTDSASGASHPEYSPDGRRIAFVGHGGGFGSPDTNGQGDVYVRDLVAGTTSLASVDAAGTSSGNGLSSQPQFSPDGRRLVFESWASNLGPTDTNEDSDLYLRDLVSGTTSLVSVNVDGTDSATSVGWGSTLGGLVSFSPDGARLAFSSRATELVPVDTNGAEDVFVHDIRTGTNELVSTRAGGTDSADGASHSPRFHPSGTSLAFTSQATNLGRDDAGDPSIPEGWFTDVFVRDLRSGRTTLVSASTADWDGLDSLLPRFSGDGRRLVFVSQSGDLGPPDAGHDWDVYVATSRGRTHPDA